MSAPTAPRAPGLVFLGNFLFAGTGVWTLVAAVGGIFAMPEYRYVHGKLTGEELAANAAAVVLWLFIALSTVFALLCLLLSLLSARGLHPARILIWVLGSAAIVVNAVFLLNGSFATLPWYATLVAITAVAMALCAGAAMVLLALPGAHGFYTAARHARLAAHHQWVQKQFQQAQVQSQQQHWPPPVTHYPPLAQQGGPTVPPAPQAAPAQPDPPAGPTG